MNFSICTLALSLSLDALGVGITYGLRKTRIPLLSKILICFFSIFYAALAQYLGVYLLSVIPHVMSKTIGVLILMSMGLWIIIQGMVKGNNTHSCDRKKGKLNAKDNKKPDIRKNGSGKFSNEELLKIGIKSLGITIQVLRDPAKCDIDKSGTIEIKESFLLGFALSIDAIGVVVGSVLSGYHSVLLPFYVGVFQIILLYTGIYLGKKIRAFGKLNEKIITLVSGIFLILLGIIRIY